MEEANRVIFIHVPTHQSSPRSVSPMSPSPRREKNLGFFHALSRRFCRRSNGDLCLNGEDDSRSSSTDSCSSTSVGRLKIVNSENSESSSSRSDSSSNDSSSNTGDKTISNNKHNSRRSSSIRRALQTLSISSRSLSCSSTPIKENNNKQKKIKQPQRILRQPVKYTYLKGMSGLPTQRVPRSSLCCRTAHR